MRKTTIGKLLSIGLAIAMLSGCGGGSAPASSAAATTAAATTAAATTAAASSEVDVSKITLKDIADANTYDSLLAKHKNWHIKCNLSQDNDQIAIKHYGVRYFNVYSEKDMAYMDVDYYEDGNEEHAIEHALYSDKGDYYINDLLQEGKKLGVIYYLMNDEDKKEIRIKSRKAPESRALFTYNEEEILDSIKDNGDGTLTVLTHAAMKEAYDPATLPDEWKEGRKEFAYKISKADLGLISLDNKIVTDNKTYDYMTEAVTYDTDRPEDLSKMLTLVDEFKNTKPDEPVYAKIVYDAGTDKEETFEYPEYRAFAITPWLRKGYKAYKDPEGTQPATDLIKPGTTLYAVKK